MDPLFKYILAAVFALTAINLFMWGLLRRRISQAETLYDELEEEVKEAKKQESSKAEDAD